jgi:phosphatidylglycerophosphate synthase
VAALDQLTEFILTAKLALGRPADRRGNSVREKKFLFLTGLFCKLRFTPNLLTALALFLALLGGSSILYKLAPLGALCFALCWFFTCFDGIYARQASAESRFGRFFNDFVNIVCELFLLLPLLIDYINLFNYFLIDMLLLLLVLRLLIFAAAVQLQNNKVRYNTAEFFGRTGFWLLILLGLLCGQLPLALVSSAAFLLVTLLQVFFQAYYLLCRAEPRVRIKAPQQKNVRNRKTVRSPAARRKPRKSKK